MNRQRRASDSNRKRVLAIVHCGRARMIGKAFNAYVPPVDAHDTLDDSNIDLLGFQNAALFDV